MTTRTAFLNQNSHAAREKCYRMPQWSCGSCGEYTELSRGGTPPSERMRNKLEPGTLRTTSQCAEWCVACSNWPMHGIREKIYTAWVTGWNRHIKCTIHKILREYLHLLSTRGISILHGHSTYNWVSIALCVITVELNALYYDVYVQEVPY